MDFTLTPDQTTLMGALDSLAERYTSKPTDAHGFVLAGDALERELEESGIQYNTTLKQASVTVIGLGRVTGAFQDAASIHSDTPSARSTSSMRRQSSSSVTASRGIRSASEPKLCDHLTVIDPTMSRR